MRHLSIDIETFSSIDIKKSGLYKYVQSADFQILLFSYSFDGESVKMIDLAQGEILPMELTAALQDASGALIAMGALNMGLKEEELAEIVKCWRASNKRIVDLWYSIENAALQVVETGQMAIIKGLTIAREADYNNRQDFLTITLPSGRKLFYVRPFIQINEFGRQGLYYRGINQDTKKWTSIPTYGGKLTENIVQAIARDCLAESLKRLEMAGYQTIMHIHDEAILDVPIEKADLKTVTDIMGQPISWAPGLLLSTDGYETEFYKKE
jgi:DNA polymerase